jgi:hypothetical protein
MGIGLISGAISINLKSGYEQNQKEKLLFSQQNYDLLCDNARQKLKSFQPSIFYEKTKKYQFKIELVETYNCGLSITLTAFQGQNKVLNVGFGLIILVNTIASFPKSVTAEQVVYQESDYIKTLNDIEKWYQVVVADIEILSKKEGEIMRYYNPDGGFLWLQGRKDFGCSQQYGMVRVFNDESTKPNFGLYEYIKPTGTNSFICIPPISR